MLIPLCGWSSLNWSLLRVALKLLMAESILTVFYITTKREVVLLFTSFFLLKLLKCLFKSIVPWLIFEFPALNTLWRNHFTFWENSPAVPVVAVDVLCGSVQLHNLVCNNLLNKTDAFLDYKERKRSTSTMHEMAATGRTKNFFF